MGLTHNIRPSDSKCPSDELHLSLRMRVLGTRYGHSNHHRRPSARTVADTPGRPFAAPNGSRRRRQRRVVVVAVGVVTGVVAGVAVVVVAVAVVVAGVGEVGARKVSCVTVQESAA